MKQLAKLYKKYLVCFLLGYKQEGQVTLEYIKHDFDHNPGRVSLSLVVFLFEFLSWVLHAVLVLTMFVLAGVISKILDVYSPFKLEITPKDEVL